MKRSIASALAVASVILTWSSATAQDTSLDLILQVQRMQQWLGTSPHADGWRRYLMLNQLESQAVKAWRGDAQVINAVLRQFDSAQPGLDHPIFDGVRRALRKHAEALPSMNNDVEGALAAAENAFVPLTGERLQSEVAELQTALMLCRRLYASHLSAEDLASTEEALKLAELQARLTELDLTPLSDNGGKPKQKQLDDLRALRANVLNFSERSTKYNDRFFAVVRRRLECAFLQYSQWLNADPRREFQQHLARLSAELSKITDPGSRGLQGEFALELGWLDATGHAPQLVAAIRSRYMLPNARFVVTEELALHAAGRPVDNQRPVSENILGRQIFGTATTTGRVNLDFVSDPDQAHISIHMLGTSLGNNHTHQGPITAYTGSHTQVEARRSILANVGGIIEYEPYAAACLNSEFRGVDCIRLVEKIAYKQYLKDKSAAEAIGARRTETRLLNEFRNESSTAIRNGKDRLAQSMQENASRVGLVPPLYVRTTDDSLLGYALKTDTFQLSATTDPPASMTVPADILLQFHESMLDNYLEPMLARQTIKNTEFAARFKEWFGEVPEGMSEPASDEIWGITFTQSRPVQFIFDGNRFGVAIAGSKFTRDEEFRDRESGERKTRVKESIDEPMLITILFRMQRSGDELVLVRDGRATVEFTREGTKTVPKNAFRSFLEDVLNKSLREQEGANADQQRAANFRAPANLIPLDRLKDPTVAKDLQLVVLRSEQGWVTAAWRHAGIPGRAGFGVDTPAIQDQSSGSGGR